MESMTGKQVTEAYVERGRELDEYLFPDAPGHYANWFTFAAWGTYNVNIMAPFCGEEKYDLLVEAMRVTYDDLMEQTAVFIEGVKPTDPGLMAYDMARSQLIDGTSWPVDVAGFVNLGNTILATREQTLLQPVLEKVFGDLPDELRNRMRLIYPKEVLVPPQPYEDFDLRTPWILRSMKDHLRDPALHANPYDNGLSQFELVMIWTSG